MEIKGGLFQVYATMPQNCQDFWFWRKFPHKGSIHFCGTSSTYKNAKVLEKMVFNEQRLMENETRYMLLKFLRVSQKLLSIPRSSPHAMVMFPYW